MVLGTGLGVLFEDNSVSRETGIVMLRMSEVEPNKAQPRKKFDESTIQALAQSIQEDGLIQPIVVRRLPDEMGYQIVAGERRWRASRMLGLSEIPAIVKELDDFTATKLALIENVQREDLNPIEEALAFKELIDSYDMTQDSVSKLVGRSRSAVANSLRLLNLPSEVQKMLENGQITVGHGKILAGIEDEKELFLLAEKAASGQLNVRQIEKAAEFLSKRNKSDKPNDSRETNSETRSLHSFCTEMELRLSTLLGRSVNISLNKNGCGKISVDFNDQNDLVCIADLLARDKN